MTAAACGVRGSVVNTDEASAYKTLNAVGSYHHVAVNHSPKEYVAGIRYCEQHRRLLGLAL